MDGLMSKPQRGKRKRNGEYVIPKSVVEYHGLRNFRSLEDEAHWGMTDHPYMTGMSAKEHEYEDEDVKDTDDEDEKAKSAKGKNFAVKKKTKTVLMK
jgi:hypothetical protein